MHQEKTVGERGLDVAAGQDRHCVAKQGNRTVMQDVRQGSTGNPSF